jgi:hypothetical protein
MKKLIVSILIAAFAAVTVLPIAAADAPAKDAPARPLPFRGKIDAVNKQAKTFKINDRTFNVTSETKISKDGKPATLDDVVAGLDVTGSSREGTDKKLNVVTLRIVAAKPAAK